MDVYKRYFRVTEGPVIEVIKEANTINAKANEEYAKIIDEVGADDRYFVNGGRLVGFMFKEGPPDDRWKQLRNGGWWPKKNIKTGKELIARIHAVETKHPEDALKEVELEGDRKPRLFANCKVYYCTMVVIPEESPVVYISVPWFDCDPEELKVYKKDSSSFDSKYEALLWEPTPEMVEVKEWEMSRHIDEWNARVKK